MKFVTASQRVDVGIDPYEKAGKMVQKMGKTCKPGSYDCVFNF